ncbi:MAG: PilZ domain-containing protein [Gemmataceae bacterium]|nr:PilZ domain-containing protein [Gemmataceae bacterium]MDW8265338.1 PilZ domain-containing protein [Gemmataceae bacterium]
MSDEPVEMPPTGERRHWVRYPCNLETLYQPGDGRLDQRWWFAKVRDISGHGIGLVLGRRFSPGTHLTLALHSPAQQFSRTLEVVVVHAQPHAEGGWLIGCSFVSVLTPQELQAVWAEQRLAQVVESWEPTVPHT